MTQISQWKSLWNRQMLKLIKDFSFSSQPSGISIPGGLFKNLVLQRCNILGGKYPLVFLHQEAF